ncbi:ABC transporter ATP-binding protein [Brevibacillus migulae]|uniref:ABC transporter ATP-binding protein n=1 Tax=Brevibacillus migulae TaxID=1644114 RepID=UPI00106E586A
MSPMLQFSQVSFSYQQRSILKDFSLQIDKGEFVSVIGPSGVGKSTLFHLANGLLQPDAGQIMLGDNGESNLLGKVGYMPQKDLLLPWRTVLENAALPLEIKGMKQEAAYRQVREQLPIFGLEGWADAYPEQLSGGMRQRVSLLRATLTGSQLLLLDEPFSALDGITKMEMQEWLLSLWRQLGITVLLITHDIEEAILLADRVLVLKAAPVQEAVEVPVSLGRPREGRLRYDPAFLAIREQIWDILTDAINAAGERGRRA